MLKQLFRDESGVAMTEYIIILVLVAIAAITVVSVFGSRIREMFTGATDALPEVTTDPDGAGGGGLLK